MAITDQLATADADLKRQRWAKYLELLAREQPDAADVNALHDLMDALGKSPADVSRDAAALAKATALQTRLAAAKGVVAREQAASDAIAAHQEETARLARERTAQLDDLQRDLTTRSQQSAAATHDIETLNDLIKKNPDLLRHLKPATHSDLI